MHILELTLIFIAAEIPLLVLGALMFATIQLRHRGKTMKNQPRTMALLSLISSALLFTAGALSGAGSALHRPLVWFNVLGAMLIALSKALVAHSREKLLRFQHQLIHCETRRLLDEQQQVRHPSE